MYKQKTKKSHKIAHAEIHRERVLHSWTGPEYEHNEKTIFWFIAAGIVALALAIYGIVSGGWSFSLAIVAFCAAYYAFHRHLPERVEIKITNHGVWVGRHFFNYAKLRKFWIVSDAPFVERLYLRAKVHFHPDIVVSIARQNPVVIRNALREHIPEWEEGDEPFTDTLVRLFRL